MKLKNTEPRPIGIMVRNTLTLTRESENIRKLVENGWTLKQIGKKYNIPEVTVHLNLYEIIKLSVSRGEFGYKKEEDFQSEEEMLKPIKYTFNNLSDDEKKIYNERKKTGCLGRYFTSDDGLHGGHQGHVPPTIQATYQKIW
jgi:hypothetical protein